MEGLIGATIKDVRPINRGEREALGIESWQSAGEIAVVVLSSGLKLVAMGDHEFNKAGAMAFIEKGNKETGSLMFQEVTK